MAENLKIKFDEKEPKIVLAIVSDGKRAATQMQGSVLDLLHAYGDLTVKLHNSFVEHGIGELEAADMLQAGIRACAQVEKVNLDGMFSGGNDAVTLYCMLLGKMKNTLRVASTPKRTMLESAPL